MGANALVEAGVDRVRAFFGLPLPEAHRKALAAYLALCAGAAPGFRWTPAENLHITIRFLGQVDRSRAEGIAGGVESIRAAAFDLALGSIGSFRRGKLARVVWLGLGEGVEDIARLVAIVDAQSVAAGFEAEARPFHAHLTLARARARDGALLPDLPPPPRTEAWRAGELVLYRSHLGRGGSVYEPLRVIRLS